MTPEQRARVQIDELLVAAGWHVCDVRQVNLHGALGVALKGGVEALT
jgi:type I restriction enzyme R subunit